MRLPFFLIACLVVAGCNSDAPPKGTLDRATFLNVYCDLIQESLRSNNSGADPQTAKQNADGVFAHRGVTRGEFDSTTHWYNADVRRWKGFFDDVAKELETRETRPAASTSPHP
jgi:hypothetical protein